MAYVILAVVVLGFGYWFYKRVKANNLPSGGTNATGNNPGGANNEYDNNKRK
jgi:hypothetical protein